jgi:hypothetical protein
MIRIIKFFAFELLLNTRGAGKMGNSLGLKFDFSKPDIMQRIGPKTRQRLAEIYETKPEYFLPTPTNGNDVEWYAASEDRGEARFIAERIAKEVGEPVD